jgi:hypothetical protein
LNVTSEQLSCSTKLVVLVALQLQVPPATNLAGCTEVNGKGISHKYVPGTGLLLDLVVMLITDVHAKWTEGLPAGEPLASGARFSARHCTGAPTTADCGLGLLKKPPSPFFF